MPGSQKVPLRGGWAEVFEIELQIKPTSKWRFVPIIGVWRLFRLGNKIGFDLCATCKAIKKEQNYLKKVSGQGILLPLYASMGGGKIRVDRGLTLEQPRFVGQKQHYQLSLLFLERTGDATIYQGSESRFDTLYSFNVWEPAPALFMWAIGILGAIVGSAIGSVLTMLIMGMLWGI